MRNLVFLILTVVGGCFAQSTNTNLLTIIPKTDLSATGEIHWRDQQPAGTNHYIGFKSPSSVSANTIWELPSADAVGCMQSDGALHLTITACGSASVINGFFVTNKTAVGPPVTTQGLQVWYNPTDFSTHILSYDGSNAPSPIFLGSSGIFLTGSASFDAAATTGPFDFIGAASGNGNIRIFPGNVAGNASLFIQAARGDQTGVQIKNVICSGGSNGCSAGVTTSDALDVLDASGAAVFKIIGSADGGAPNTVGTWDIAPLGATETKSLGNSTHRWLKLWVKDFDITGTGNAPWVLKSGDTMSGNLLANAPGTLALGSKPTPWGSVYAMANVSSRKLEVYGSTATDLTSSFFSIQMPFEDLVAKQMAFYDDSAPTPIAFLKLWRLNGGVSDKRGEFDGDWNPALDNTYNLGSSGGAASWKDIYWKGILKQGSTTRVDGSGNAIFQSVTCTGSPCGGAGVINGYFVQNNTAVTPTPTATGVQMSFDPSSNVGSVKVYDNTNTLAPLELATSILRLIGTPVISAVGAASPPLTLNGAVAGNGNILINPGNISPNSSLIVQTARGDLPGMVVKNVVCSLSTNGCTAGVTTSDALEIQDAGGGVVFRVIGSADAMSANTVATYDVAPIGVTETKSLGNPAHRWLKIWVKDFDITGTGNAPWVLKTGDTMSGNLLANAAGTLALGSKPTPWGSVYAMANASSRKVEVYASTATDLTGGFFSLQAPFDDLVAKQLAFYDDTNAAFLKLWRLNGGVSDKRAEFDGDWNPAITNTYNLGSSGLGANWHSLYFNGSLIQAGTTRLNASGDASLRSLTCTGTPCGSGDVTNGFFVQNNTVVSPIPTSPGFQMSFDTSGATKGVLRAYNFSNVQTVIEIASSAINLVGTPVINASGSSSPPLTLNGANSGNGNIVLNPGAVASNASVAIQTALNTQPGLIVYNPTGSSTGINVMEVRLNASSTAVWKIINSTDTGCPNCMVSYSHNPHDTSGSDSLGDSSHRWNTFANALNVGGVSTFNGNLVAVTGNTLGLGSAATPFGSVWAQSNVSSLKYQVYDSGASNLSGSSFWAITSQDGPVNKTLHITDDAGGDILSLWRLSGGSAINEARFDAHVLPKLDATYDIGSGSNRFRNGWWSGSLIVGTLACTGSPCGGSSTVANGFFVTGNSNVGVSTIQGWQASFNTSNNTTLLKSYNGSNTPSIIEITSSVINLAGTPTITATGSGPFQLNGSTISNGNILMVPGAVAGNASVRVFQALNSQPAMKVVNIGGSTTSTVLEVDDASNIARFWVESSGNSTTTTGGPSYVHTASIYPANDALFDLGVNGLRYRSVNVYGAQIGLTPTDVPSGTTLQSVQNGINVLVVDAFSAGGGIPSFVARSASGTQASPSNSVSGSVLFSLSGRGWDGGFTSTGSAAISFLANQNFGGGQEGADIFFETTAVGAAANGGRLKRIQVTSTGLNPFVDNTYSLGTSALRFSDLRSVNATINTLNVGTCVGCGGITSVNPTSPISASIFGTTLSISCPTCVATNTNNTFTGTNQFAAITMAGDITPDAANTRNLGSLFRPLNGVIAANMVGSAITAGTLSVNTGFGSVFVGSGNFYNRSFFGAPSCSGVGDGWTGIDTSGTGKIWVCISGVARSVGLL